MLPLLLIATLNALVPMDGYKILVYNPKFAHSHSNFIGSLADILADAGHNVTSLIPIMNDKIKDGTTKSTPLYVQATDTIREQMAFLLDDSINLYERKTFDPIATFVVSRMIGNLFATTCRNVLDEPGLIGKLRNEHYDVFLVETFDICGLGVSHVIQPKSLISGSSTFFFGDGADEAGLPLITSFNPSSYIDHLDVHSIVSRAWNIAGEYLLRQFFANVRAYVRDLFVEKYGPDFPSWAEITSHSAYSFANAEPLIDFAASTLHRVINIPAIGAEEPKPLDEEWLHILSLRNHSVLVSFGSVAEGSKLNIASKRGLLKTFANFPEVTFIWKYEKNDKFAMNEASKVGNVVLSKWMPQNDLLNHDNLAAFVSHGGMGSVQETARRGVPGIFVPLFGDQPRNAAMMEHNGLGKVYDKCQLHNSEKLTAALKEILEDESYAKRARHVSRMLASKPFTSREILIKHIEFAAEFGPSPSLRPQSYDMNTIEYYNLDIILAFVLVSSALFIVFVKCLALIVRRIVVKKCKRD